MHALLNLVFTAGVRQFLSDAAPRIGKDEVLWHLPEAFLSWLRQDGPLPPEG